MGPCLLSRPSRRASKWVSVAACASPCPSTPTPIWGKRLRHYVRETIDGTAFSGSLGSRAGAAFVPLSKNLQMAATVSIGSVVEVTLQPAPAETEVVSADLTVAPGDDGYSTPGFRIAHALPAQPIRALDRGCEEAGDACRSHYRRRGDAHAREDVIRVRPSTTPQCGERCLANSRRRAHVSA